MSHRSIEGGEGCLPASVRYPISAQSRTPAPTVLPTPGMSPIWLRGFRCGAAFRGFAVPSMDDAFREIEPFLERGELSRNLGIETLA